MRRVSKVLTVLALLGAVTAFAPSFFPTNTTLLSIAEASTFKFRCSSCKKEATASSYDEVKYKHSDEKCPNKVGATAGPHDWTYVGEVK